MATLFLQFTIFTERDGQPFKREFLFRILRHLRSLTPFLSVR